MHEATIAHSILNIVKQRLDQTPHAESAVCVSILVGSFRNVDIESLEFAFDCLKRDIEGCSRCFLKAELVLARAFCQSERHRYSPDLDHQFRCPQCGSGIGELICGEELDVIGITLAANAGEDSISYA